jgi:hypothetical protein
MILAGSLGGGWPKNGSIHRQLREMTNEMSNRSLISSGIAAKPPQFMELEAN